MPWVLQRTDHGRGYVARPGALRSYVRTPWNARTFASKEAAQADACGNERPVFVDLHEVGI